MQSLTYFLPFPQYVYQIYFNMPDHQLNYSYSPFWLGTIRATIMIETLPAAVDIEEMIYELKDYCCGANAGRWDYIFSIIKRLQTKQEAVLPDRKQVL